LTRKKRVTGMARIVFIGAGSVVFTRNLVKDVLSYPALDDSEIVLMDINAGRLAKIEKLVARLAGQQGSRVTVRATGDRREALRGAHYVVFTVQVGGVELWGQDIDIPARYGVSQCVGDTLGPGGVFRGLRHLAVLDDVLRDMAEVCPSATLLQYSNPMSILTWRAAQSSIRTVGLCHSVQGTAAMLAEWCGVPESELVYWAAGINHQAWFLTLRQNEEDLYPRLRQLVLEPNLRANEPVRIELFERFGYFVTESSGHASEYYPYFRKDASMVERLVERFKEAEPGVHEWLGYGATGGCPADARQREREYERIVQRQISGQEPIEVDRSSEYGVQIINALETGEQVQVNANVPNDGLVTNLPPGSCVEVPCLVGRHGIHPCHVGPLPPQVAALNRASISLQELTLLAHKEADPERVFQALAMDPLTATCCTLDQIWALGKEMLEANEGALPQFAKVLH
jgi:alpha-galactosidase